MKVRHKIMLVAAGVIHAALLYLMLTRQLDFLFNDASHRMGPGTDFLPMYFAGKYWLGHESIYGHGPGFGFRYLPVTATTLFAWLTSLKPYTAFYVWVGLTEALLLASVALMKKLIPHDPAFVAIAFLVALFSPAYLDIYMGNSNLISASLLLIAYLLDRHSYRIAALSIFIIACLIKPVGLFLLPVLLVKYGWRPVIATVLSIALLSAPYFARHGGDLSLFLLQNVTDARTADGFLVHAGSQGFAPFLARIFVAFGNQSLGELSSINQLSVWCRIVLYGWLALVAGLTLRITWRQRKNPNLELLLFLYIAAYLLVYKDVWEHSYALLFFALPMLYLSGTVRPRTLLICAGLLALPTALAFYDLSFDSSRLHDPDWNWSTPVSLVHHATKSCELLALYVIVMGKSLRGTFRVPHWLHIPHRRPLHPEIHTR